MHVETGDLISPDGTPYQGFKVTIGGVQDPAMIQRTYDDIEKILYGNKMPYKVSETHDSGGHFRSYTVVT